MICTSAVLEGTNSALWPIVSILWYRATFADAPLLSFFLSSSFLSLPFSHTFLHGVNTSGERSYRAAPHVYLNATLWEPGLRILDSNARYPNREARILRLKSCAGFRFGRRHAGLKELRMSVVCYLRSPHAPWGSLPLIRMKRYRPIRQAQLMPSNSGFFFFRSSVRSPVRSRGLSIRQPENYFSSVNLISPL